MLVRFLELFGQEDKFETWFENFVENFFLKWLGSNFLKRNQLSKYNLIMNFQS